MEEDQALIPGLPDDIALDCIARVAPRFLPGLRPICRRWRDLLASPSFRHRREKIGSAEDLIFLVQALGGSATTKDPAKPPEPTDLRPPVYALSLYTPADNSWHRLASPDPIPMFAHCVTVGTKLVLVGGWDPATLDPVPDVRILDLATGAWRKSKPMTAARSFFACAAVRGKVYVAGGHDGMKNALRTAEVYDVEADEWAAMPPMADERDESQGVAIGGTFWVLSGYGTEGQGRFRDSAEWYDSDNGIWKTEEGIFVEEIGTVVCYVGGENLWCVGKGGLKEYVGGSGWKEVGKGVEGVCGAVMGAGRVFVMGGPGEGGGYAAWVSDIGRANWRRIDTPPMFSGFGYSAAAVRI